MQGSKPTPGRSRGFIMRQSQAEKIHQPGRLPATLAQSGITLASLFGRRLDALGQQVLLQHALGASDLRQVPVPNELSVLLLEGVHDSAARLFAEAGYARVRHV